MHGKMDTLKERLEYYMRRGGLKPTTLSKKTRLKVTPARDILDHGGIPNPRIDTFVKLCRALGVAPHQLSPDFEKLYSPRQRELLADINDLDERDSFLQKEIAKEKSKKKPV